jgi:hypothetical protein
MCDVCFMQPHQMSTLLQNIQEDATLRGIAGASALRSLWVSL